MFTLDLAFWVLAVVGVGSSIAVVSQKDIFRAALFLVLSFLVVAGLFILLNAEFLAVVQVLVYVGAISILILFAIMLTSNVQEANLSNNFHVPAMILSAGIFIAITFATVNTGWNTWDGLGLNVLPGDSGDVLSYTERGVRDLFGDTTHTIARLIMREFVLPMEVVSVVLLAALVGALALVREREGES